MFILIKQPANYKLAGTGIYIGSDSLPTKYLLITKGKREVSVVRIISAALATFLSDCPKLCVCMYMRVCACVCVCVCVCRLPKWR